MYRAKLAGKNGVRYYDATMLAPALERAAVAEHLDGALERAEIDLCYQPQWDARTGTVASFEALVRWTSPTLGEVAPRSFVPIAEERGAFSPIVSWSLDACGATARALSDSSALPLRVALNVARARVASPWFLTQVEQAVRRHRLQPQQLEFELTMGGTAEVDQSLRVAIEHLRGLGLRVTLDCFGADTGLVASLLDLPFDGVKLEPQLVRRAEGDAGLLRGLEAVVALVHDLGREVTAVGVETESQRDAMLEIGCERLQGYLFGRPMSRADAAALLGSQPVVTLF
jgi:diguanylate cyclase